MSTTYPSTADPPRRRRPSAEWEAAPVVTVFRACCPHCRSESYKADKTKNIGDDIRMLHAVCRTCGKPFKINREPMPELGEFILWPVTIRP